MGGGFLDPIGVWGPDNIIVEGHGRHRAAIELGIKSVPCIRLDHLSDQQRRLYTLSHNRTAEISVWDNMKCSEETTRLLNDGFDIRDIHDLGFDSWLHDFDLIDINELDAADEFSDNNPIIVKMTFSDYAMYQKHEAEIKQMADSTGAVISLVRT